MESRMPSGAEKLIQCLEREGVEYIFGLSGGAAIPIFDALVESSINLILVRHEQGAVHMADGYARATGRPGVVLVTSGPGATNTVTGLLTAHMDSVPIVVITGQCVTDMLGKDGFQEADVTGITYAVVKHSYLVRDSADIPRITREAFYISTTGRPGPVLIDLPKNVSQGPCDAPFVDDVELPGYSIPGRADPEDIATAAAHLSAARKPVLLVGHGAVIADAGKAVIGLAEKLHSPVVNTLLGKGAVDETHPLHLGMLGMHGTAYANKAMDDADLIMSIGSRWDDRITGKLDEFCLGAIKIHVDIDPAEFNKMVRPDVCLMGDARLVVEDLLPLVERGDTDEWIERIKVWRKRYPLKYPKQGGLRAQHVLDRLDALTEGRAIISTDVGQHQMWAAQFCRTTTNRHWMSSGGAGTMGFGFPAAIGAQFGQPEKEVWAVVGDGGFQMTQAELATAAIHGLRVKCLIINNNYLGMVRQWQELFFENRLSGVELEGNPDFVKLAQAYGIKAFRIRRPADVDRILRAAHAYDEGPCVVVAEVVKEDNVFPMIPSGAPFSSMIVEKPKEKLDKPVGST
ncbi:MAG: biosynthetic-type acetolactate synthase large subunit [Deltaproteobacteria bacterium]|nr:biosynthetic-type acetolactate synthase large subunit [Deltaproteobacteria bacterium]MBW2386176.1 biosynthetic-type acetolactate synthase large subunit [Deltaproteobacteria bacterium]